MSGSISYMSQWNGVMSSKTRPCVLLSNTQTPAGVVCQIALLATYSNHPQDSITNSVLQHFSIPISQISPRLAYAASSADASSRHQYVVACIGSVGSSQLLQWIDNGQLSGTILDENALRRLEAMAIERRQSWEQLNSPEMYYRTTSQVNMGYILPGALNPSVSTLSATPIVSDLLPIYRCLTSFTTLTRTATRAVSILIFVHLFLWSIPEYKGRDCIAHERFDPLNWIKVYPTGLVI
jgi:hypothetical protein